MAEEKKVGLNKWGKPSKSGKDWNEQAGYFGKPENKEKQMAASKKGAAVSAERSKARKKIKDILAEPEGFRGEMLENILEVHPDALAMFSQVVFKGAMDGDKTFADMLMKMMGAEAPKKSEVKTVQEEMSVEDAQKLLGELSLKAVDNA